MSHPIARHLVPRLHPFGPPCSVGVVGACYFMDIDVSEEYRARQESGDSISKRELNAIAKVALQLSVRSGDLPQEALRTRIEVVDVPVDEIFAVDQLVLLDHRNPILRAMIRRVVEVGLDLVNARWLTVEAETGFDYETRAFYVGRLMRRNT